MKKMSIFKILIPPSFLLLVLCLFTGSLHAETKFVSGIIVVNIRDSIEKQSKIIGTVKTGDQVELLEEGNNFSRVKTKDLIEGWVPSHYLHAEIPTAETIIKLKEELIALKKKNDQFAANKTNIPTDSGLQEDQRKKLNQSLELLKIENKRLLEDNQKFLRIIQEKEQSAQTRTSENSEADALKEKVVSLQNKLDVLTNNSKDIINITNERDSLSREIEIVKTELASMQKFNQKLENDKMFSWFFAGAAVFFVGLLSSKIFTRRKSKLTF
jgi:SH3 domain protein